ncbi:hypothetical protein LCGC14_0420290 [marine sediment metagenome]|uniref:Uncharacterized protein n=1 Tax=marine sediment metagenome TaxID=412755 RepID=A0A0F9SQZ6_9ZZZZ
MKLVSQEEARKIAERCKFKSHCHVCLYLGQEESDTCCGFCVDYSTDRCKGIVCPDFKTECPMGLDKIHCYGCWFVRGGQCEHDRIMEEAK